MTTTKEIKLVSYYKNLRLLVQHISLRYDNITVSSTKSYLRWTTMRSHLLGNMTSVVVGIGFVRLIVSSDVASATRSCFCCVHNGGWWHAASWWRTFRFLEVDVNQTIYYSLKQKKTTTQQHQKKLKKTGSIDYKSKSDELPLTTKKTLTTKKMKKKSRRRGSNTGSFDYKSNALPLRHIGTFLRYRDFFWIIMSSKMVLRLLTLQDIFDKVDLLNESCACTIHCTNKCDNICFRKKLYYLEINASYLILFSVLVFRRS